MYCVVVIIEWTNLVAIVILQLNMTKNKVLFFDVRIGLGVSSPLFEFFSEKSV